MSSNVKLLSLEIWVKHASLLTPRLRTEFNGLEMLGKVKGTMLQWSVGGVLISRTLAFEPEGG